MTSDLSLPSVHYTCNCYLCVCVCLKMQGGGGASGDSEQLYSTSPHTKSLPQPIGRPERTSSTSSDTFQRAVGAEVKSKSLEDEGQVQVTTAWLACTNI